MARKEMDSIGICATEVMMGFFFQPSKVRLMMMTDPTAPIMTTISHPNLGAIQYTLNPHENVHENPHENCHEKALKILY